MWFLRIIIVTQSPALAYIHYIFPNNMPGNVCAHICYGLCSTELLSTFYESIQIIMIIILLLWVEYIFILFVTDMKYILHSKITIIL